MNTGKAIAGFIFAVICAALTAKYGRPYINGFLVAHHILQAPLSAGAVFVVALVIELVLGIRFVIV
jgi:hypothetical protein